MPRSKAQDDLPFPWKNQNSCGVVEFNGITAEEARKMTADLRTLLGNVHSDKNYAVGPTNGKQNGMPPGPFYVIQEAGLFGLYGPKIAEIELLDRTGADATSGTPEYHGKLRIHHEHLELRKYHVIRENIPGTPLKLLHRKVLASDASKPFWNSATEIVERYGLVQ